MERILNSSPEEPNYHPSEGVCRTPSSRRRPVPPLVQTGVLQPVIMVCENARKQLYQPPRNLDLIACTNRQEFQMDTCWRCLLDIASYYHEQECLAGARRHEEQLLVIDEYQAKRPRLVQECESFESSFMDVSNCSQKAGEEVVGPWNLSKQSSECNLQETAEVNCSLVLDTPRSTRRFPKRRLFPNQRGTAHKKFDYLSLVNVPLA